LSHKIDKKYCNYVKKAQDKMGKKFDVKLFHEKVLESSVMPLVLLEKKIELN
jgi:uncharacterized protein (DUF885 family)